MIGLAYICPKAEIIDEKMIAAAHALKIKVYAYHTNTKVLGENLIKWGVDDIGTDFPKIFQKYLTKA
jgi:glycerophosphoryl diester phosphodiesterase